VDSQIIRTDTIQDAVIGYGVDLETEIEANGRCCNQVAIGVHAERPEFERDLLRGEQLQGGHQ
jgi:hypothetical protein